MPWQRGAWLSWFPVPRKYLSGAFIDGIPPLLPFWKALLVIRFARNAARPAGAPSEVPLPVDGGGIVEENTHGCGLVTAEYRPGASPDDGVQPPSGDAPVRIPLSNKPHHGYSSPIPASCYKGGTSGVVPRGTCGPSSQSG